MTEDVCLTPDDRKLAADRYVELLRRDGSPLLAEPDVTERMAAQLNGVLDAALEVVDARRAQSRPDRDPSSASGGRVGELSGVHPGQSLHAAALLFEATLPMLINSLAEAGWPDPAATASVALNHVIMDRMRAASEVYVGVLLDRLHATRSDERIRISRDLHDVVAPPLDAAIQNLHLHEMYQDDGDTARAAEKLQAAEASISDAIRAVRAIAAATRHGVSGDGIEHALTAALAHGPTEVAAELSLTGDTDLLPPAYAEELFLIVQEAVRNTFLHAAATKLTVTVHIKAHRVVATITDNGRGFDPAAAAQVASSGTGVGTTAMRERAALLGGTATIHSAPGNGTRIKIQVPLPPHPAPSHTTDTR
ncbi:MAG: ATP-binding protein [Actinomycetia bacterium]|nr:ATP-binding protein [Actinomycetes bacterium]